MFKRMERLEGFCRRRSWKFQNRLLVEGDNGNDEDGNAGSDGKNAMHSEDSI